MTEQSPDPVFKASGRLNRWWRLIGTGASFTLFGIGGLVVGLLIAPVMWLVVRNSYRRERAMRWVIGRSFAAFVGTMRLLGVLDYRITGVALAAVPDRCLIVANHPSLIDVVFLLSLFPDADCVVKSAHWSNPFTMAAVRSAGYVPNSDPVQVIEQCVERLKLGRRLVLFPEGTRTTPGEAVSFNRGAASIALRAGADCVPVRLGCSPTTLTKADRWHDIPPSKVFFEVDIKAPLRARDYLGPDSPERIASRHLNVDLLNMLNADT